MTNYMNGIVYDKRDIRKSKSFRSATSKECSEVVMHWERDNGEFVTLMEYINEFTEPRCLYVVSGWNKLTGTLIHFTTEKYEQAHRDWAAKVKDLSQT